jgi:cysteate synthase
MLRCLGCGATYEVEMRVHCSSCGPRALLRTVYPAVSGGMPLQGPADEFESYRAWLPFQFRRELPTLKIGCVQAPELAAELGIGELWLLISGFAPDHGATLPTCTFKTLEAAGVLERVLSFSDSTLIISSAGNAGTAVLEFGARWNVPAVVIVPESAVDWMYTTHQPGERAPILIGLKDATYLDAIDMVGHMVERFGDRVVREGGAFNVARRDSMGVPLLRAAQAIGRIPDNYFQSVGSGTGAIAAYEASLRLAEAGTEGGPMRLHLMQNRPFTPMHDAWKAGAETVEVMPREQVLERVAKTYTHMLSNAKPPYSLRGGVRDLLLESNGDMYAVDNDEARAGHAKIVEHYGVSPAPEGGAAVAGLIQAARAGVLGKDEVTLVHLTGAGWERSLDQLGRKPYPVALRPDVGDKQAVADAIERYLDAL